MKVLMIIPSLGAGGAERVLSGLANDWAEKKKCTLEIILFTDVKDFYVINHNIKVHRFNYKSHSSNKIFDLLKLILKVRKKIMDINPDVCLSFLRESNILVLLSCLGLNKKIFLSERDSPETYVPTHYRILRKNLYPLATGIIAQTHDYKIFINNELNSNKSIVIPNPVRDIDTSGIKKQKIILNVGRLVPEKGHKYLLEAFALCENKSEWKLVLVGDGVLRKDLEERVKVLKISHQVEFIGRSNKVDEWLAKSSIFAFSSISEGFPNALAEAMSASLPCVSFDCVTGPRDLISNKKNGFLVDIKNVNKFSKYLDILMKDEELRLMIGAEAKRTTKKLDFNKISNRYFEYLCSNSIN